MFDLKLKNTIKTTTAVRRIKGGKKKLRGQ